MSGPTSPSSPSGPNAASPHHDPSARVIGDGDVVLCDFGGTMHGYCSDITRMFVVGEPGSEVRDAYAVLVEAQEAGVRAATVGTRCEEVDAAARRVIVEAGYGDYFVHRTGHGIGTEAHEDPYVVAGNATPLVPGHAFSVEPGIYLPGRFGLRLEDIVVATDARTGAAQPRATRSRDRGVAMQLDLATLLAQWATGGLFFCWVTTRRREVGIGYGWLLRISFGVMAVLSVVSGAGDAGRGRRDPQRLHRAHGAGRRGRLAAVVRAPGRRRARAARGSARRAPSGWRR